MNEPIVAFWQEVKSVGDTLSECQDYNAVRPQLQKLVEIVGRHSELTDVFADAFIQIIEQPDRYSSLVVSYAMHVLQMESVRQYVEKEIKKDHLKTNSRLRHIAHAFSPDWSLKPIFFNNTIDPIAPL